MLTQLWVRWLHRALSYYRIRQAAAGQGLVEYALILVFVSVVMVIILTVLGPGISNIYSNIVNMLNNP